MKMRIAAMITLMAFMFGVTGCVTTPPVPTIPEEHRGAAVGAGVGAATGAVAGAVLAGEGSRAKGAIIGGLVGALLGGAIGHYTVDKKKTAHETTTKYAYDQSAGTVVRIEDSNVMPHIVAPGGTVNLEATYAVMATSGEIQVPITESREVTFNGELVGNPEVSVHHATGTYHTTVPLFLPADANKGKYKVITTIRSAAGKDSRESSFTVQ